MTATALRFDHLRSTHPRARPATQIVLHWTAGTHGADAVYRTLRATVGPRTPDGLSIHYVVDSDGTATQMCALDRVCLHAGAANAASVGIEVVSPGIPGSLSEGERERGVVRDEYDDRIRGRRVTMLDYTAAQAEAVSQLVEQICDRLHIPRSVPLEHDGSLMRRQMTDAELASYRGVLGHYHCHETKLDPGTRPLERLRLRWLGVGSA